MDSIGCWGQPQQERVMDSIRCWGQLVLDAEKVQRFDGVLNCLVNNNPWRYVICQQGGQLSFNSTTESVFVGSSEQKDIFRSVRCEKTPQLPKVGQLGGQ
jgi:hypothetical protein